MAAILTIVQRSFLTCVSPGDFCQSDTSRNSKEQAKQQKSRITEGILSNRFYLNILNRIQPYKLVTNLGYTRGESSFLEVSWAVECLLERKVMK